MSRGFTVLVAVSGARFRLGAHGHLVLVLAALLGLASLVPGATTVIAQDGETPVESESVPSEGNSPGEAEPPPPAPEPTPIPVVDPAPVPELPAEPAEPSAPVAEQPPTDQGSADTGTIEGVSPDDAAGVNDPSAPIVDASSPAALATYAPAPEVICRIAEAQPGEITHGASLDYTCTHAVALTGTALAPSAVAVEWSASAQVDGAWAVQLRAPAAFPGDVPVWTPPGRPDGTIAFRTASIGEDGAPVPTFSESRDIAFGMRVHRAACDLAPVTVVLTVTAVAEAAGDEEVTISPTDDQPAQLRLTPALAPIPAPSVAFAGPLDLGTVGVSAAGPSVARAEGTLSVRVSELDRACGTWQLTIAAEDLEGTDASAITADNLLITSVDGQPLSDGPCSLDAGCVVAEIPAGDAESGTRTFVLGVSLALPDQATATTFNTTVTAAITAAE